MSEKMKMLSKASNSRSKNSTRNFVTGSLGQLLAILLRFITRTVFIYTLGKEYLGISGLFTDIFMMLSLTELGIETAIHFRMYKPLVENDDQRIRVLLKFYKRAYLVIGLSILTLGLCLIPLLPYLIKDYDMLAELKINAVLIFVLYLFQTVTTYLFFAYRSSVVIASQQKYLLDIAAYIITIFDYAVRLLILFIWKSYIGYVIVGIGSSILKNLVRALIAQRLYPQYFLPEKESMKKTEIREMFKDCGALFFFKANTVVIKATDNLVLSSFVGLAVVGVYSNYLMLYTTLRNLLNQVHSSLSASLGNMFAQENVQKSYSIFETLNFATAIIFGTAAVGIAVCADELICTWISKDYMIAQPFAILVGVELLLSGMQNVIENIRSASGIFQKLWYRPLLGIVVNIVVSITMVNVCGIYGVIIGTIVAYLSTIFLFDPFVIYKYTFHNYRPVSEYYRKNLLYFVVLTIVCALDLLICRYILVGYGWLSVIIHAIITGISVPLVFLLLFHNIEECKYLLKICRRFLNKRMKKQISAR